MLCGHDLGAAASAGIDKEKRVVRLRRGVWIAVAAVILGLVSGVALAAYGSAVTTNGFSASSTSSDIAVSCQKPAVHSATGVLKGTCNQAGSTDDQVNTNETEIDLDNAVWCDANEADDHATLKLGSGTNSGNQWSPEGWKLDTSSNGNDYILTARCYVAGWHVTAEQTVDIGDTTNGLQNSSGKFATR